MLVVTIVRNERDVGGLLKLWNDIRTIRARLVERLADSRRATQDLEARLTEEARDGLHGAQTDLVVERLRELVRGEVVAATAALAELDRVLATKLGRATPPWDIPQRFSSLARPGIRYERALAFARALRWLTPLAEGQRARLRALNWLPGEPLPPPIAADPTTPGFAELAPAAGFCIDAMHTHWRLKGVAPTEMTLALAGAQIVRVLQEDEVASLLFGVEPGSGASAPHAASAILGSFVGLGWSAVQKALVDDVTEVDEAATTSGEPTT